MARKFTLYWTSLEMYEACPQKYLWYRGWGTLDLGGGLGRPKPLPVKPSEHHLMMGKAIGKVVEDFYNLELWKDAPPGLADRLAERAEREFLFELARGFVDFRKAPSKSEMIKICRDGAIGFLRTVKLDKLLGPYAKAEVNLIGQVDPVTPVGGRADIIMRRDDTGVSILDGKNSQSKGKYTDPDQLRWYAMCYRLVHGVLPDRLGFIYFRYPADSSTGTSGVDWIPFTEADVDGLAARAVAATASMHAGKFQPTPSPKVCRLCDYETVCSARQEQRASNSSHRHKNDDSFPSGIVDLGFDTEGS
jgi:hypothetical protein